MAASNRQLALEGAVSDQSVIEEIDIFMTPKENCVPKKFWEFSMCQTLLFHTWKLINTVIYRSNDL